MYELSISWNVIILIDHISEMLTLRWYFSRSRLQTHIITHNLIQFILKSGKSESTGPTEIMRVAEKLKRIFNANPLVKSYCTKRHFFRYIEFFWRGYRSDQPEFITRFLVFAQVFLSANYFNSLYSHKKSISFKVTDSSDSDYQWDEPKMIKHNGAIYLKFLQKSRQICKMATHILFIMSQGQELKLG